MQWFVVCTTRRFSNGRIPSSVEVFLRYVDDRVRTVKGDPGLVLEAANKLHRNLQFTIEELDSNSDLGFLGLNVNVDSGKKGHMWVV